MAVFALVSKRTVVFVILAMAADATCGQGYFIAYRDFVAIGTAYVLVLSIQLELRFIVVEIPILPIARVVAILTTCSQRAFMCVLLFVT